MERLYRLTARQLDVDRRLVGQRSVSTVLAAASAILQVTGDDIRAAALDPSRPLADRERGELATMVVRTTPARAKQLMRQLRALLAAALRVDGTGPARTRMTLAFVPQTPGIITRDDRRARVDRRGARKPRKRDAQHAATRR